MIQLSILDQGQSTKPPLVVSYGAGVDSTAILIEFIRLGIKPDLIMFANTGGEKPETYQYIKLMNEYLASHDYPQITIVQYIPKRAPYKSLEENCTVNGTLPSLAFGYKSCSLKWKVQPQDKYCNNWLPARDTWNAGQKVLKVIGYDNGEKDGKRAHRIGDDKKYKYWYPLRDWGWDRPRCAEEIIKAGLPLPIKSACFYCPASQPEELTWLAHKHPTLFLKSLAIEQNADDRGGMTKIQGLWRSSTKKKPGAWRMYAVQNELAVYNNGVWEIHPNVRPENTPEFPQDAVGCGGF